ncbi:MAG TPA: preprotein translocase subunit SecE [Bacteroidetes bacterium]|jgi:preprotein translocase subunit SecE|nr:preprotein translocase subunit SecE [Bacteroidota bacterium]
MSRIVEIWKNTSDELVNKVSWPSWEELRSSTAIVIVASVIFALVLWVIDSALGGVMDLLYSLLK